MASATSEQTARRIVLASSNKGKLVELDALLAPLGFELHLQAEFATPDADETGLSFIENAILKARHACSYSQLPAIADDSGLEVDALRGAPGIYSARFAARAGFNASDLPPDASKDARNNACLLQQLDGVPTAQRSARFRCALAFMRHAEDPAPLVASAHWEGHILQQPSGSNGFGYDPLFFADDAGCAAAELDKAEKLKISHRGQALQLLLRELQQHTAIYLPG